jgi:hypothetical protein
MTDLRRWDARNLRKIPFSVDGSWHSLYTAAKLAELATQ